MLTAARPEVTVVGVASNVNLMELLASKRHSLITSESHYCGGVNLMELLASKRHSLITTARPEVKVVGVASNVNLTELLGSKRHSLTTLTAIEVFHTFRYSLFLEHSTDSDDELLCIPNCEDSTLS
ncbi:hypothetical protein QE152_g13561 [Popillia japonica]|uniref:Uncharacterized protein n=1 Tax=Popillia japonica TaxID=7064 RepID=A0AAW1LDB4_POPJA